MKMLLSLALVASLSACAPSPGTLSDRLVRAAPAINAAQARYDAVQPYVAMILPYLPPERAARIRLAQSLVERGLLAARTASSVAEQRAAIAQAEAATAVVTATAH